MHINAITHSTPETGTKRAEEKDVFKFYWTEPAAIEAYLSYTSTFKYRNAVDLGCNDGRWLELMRRYGITIDRAVGIDIRPIEKHYLDVFHQADVLTFPEDEKFDLVVSNPPFSTLLNRFLLKAFNLVNREDGLVSFFMPITALATETRKKIFDAYPPTRVLVYSTRPHCDRMANGKPGSYPGREMAQFEWCFIHNRLKGAAELEIDPIEWITYDRDGRLESIEYETLEVP